MMEILSGDGCSKNLPFGILCELFILVLPVPTDSEPIKPA